jgi:hypothetical protein
METVTKKVAKRDNQKLFNSVEEYLQLNATIATFEEQKKGLKIVIDSILERNPNLMTDGECVLEGVGRITQVDNKPQLVSLQTGKPLVPAEAAQLLKVIGKQYETKSVSVIKVKDAIEANNADIIQKLAEQEVALQQVTRHDIKPPLKKLTDVEAMNILRRR